MRMGPGDRGQGAGDRGTIEMVGDIFWGKSEGLSGELGGGRRSVVEC